MNKKRVALALAAALSVNTLMVTVGQVGQQAVVAHAVDGKLTNQDDINKLNGLKIKTLKSELTTNASGETVVNFPELKDSIKSLNVKSFTHTPFAERADIETVATVTHKVEGQTLNLGKLTTPGIYTGEVEVTLGDGSKESYTLTLRKTPVDTLSYDVDVTVGQLTVSGLKLNNGDKDLDGVVTENNLELHTADGRIVKATKGTNANEYKFNLLDLADKGKVKEGDVLELRAKYGKGKEYEVVSKILLVKQEKPVIKSAFMSNDKTEFAKIEDQIKTDFGGTNVTSTANSFSLDNKDVFDYKQTMDTNATDPLGAKVNISTSGSEVDLSISGGVSASGANSVYRTSVSYGELDPKTNKPKSIGLIGDYTLTIGNTTVTYFDAMDGLKAEAFINVDDPSKNHLSIIDNSGKTDSLPDGINSTSGNIKVDLRNNLEHGYTSIAGSFGYSIEEDWKQIEDANASLVAVNSSNAVATLKRDDSNKGNIDVTLIVSADALDGIGSGVTFTRTSESEGELKFTSPVKDGKLTVEGASVIGSNGEYKVQFNTSVPSSFTWKLEVGGKSIDGQVSTGQVEALNVDSVKLENLPQINDQFQVNSKFNLFDKEIPTVDNVNSNRVTLEKFSKGSHTLNVTTKTGKYQGTYTAGVVVEQQSFVIGLKEKPNASTSNSATLIVKGTNVDKDALNNVTKATLQYKEKNSNTWKNDADINLKTLQSQKEFDLTKAHLNPNTEYDFRIAYEVKTNDNKTNTLYTNVVTIKTLTSTSSNSGNSTITGNGGSSTSGTSTGNITVNVTNNNLTVNGSNIGVRIPSSIKYDSNKTPVVVGVKYKDNNGKTISEVNSQFKNVVARFNGDNVELEGLVPGKEYVEISVDYTDNNGKVKTIILRNPKFDSNVENDKYLANIYNVVFSRPADETGYQFHLNNLKGKNVSLREFVLNMLSEKEFIEAYNTTEKKIEALYNAIVNRNSDENGRKFWVEEYRKVLSVYGSESTALKAIAERMVNENELKTLAEKLNFRW